MRVDVVEDRVGEEEDSRGPEQILVIIKKSNKMK